MLTEWFSIPDSDLLNNCRLDTRIVSWSESEDTRTGNDGVIGRPYIKVHVGNAGARRNLGLLKSGPDTNADAFSLSNDNRPAYSTGVLLPMTTDLLFRLTFSSQRRPTHFPLTKFPPKRQRSNLLTTEGS